MHRSAHEKGDSKQCYEGADVRRGLGVQQGSMLKKGRELEKGGETSLLEIIVLALSILKRV